MTEKAIVVAIDSCYVTVKKTEIDSCNSCRVKHMCGVNGKSELVVKTSETFYIGQLVELVIEPKARIIAALLFFMAPLFFFITSFYIARFSFSFRELTSIGIAFCCLGFSFYLIYLLNKILRKKLLFKVTIKDIPKC